jgi:hypothetical protein
MRPQRCEYKGFYLEKPHPDRGGVWYASTYDRGTRNVRRRGLRTADFETAKARLIALVEAAPARAEDAAHPRDVAAVHVLTAYLDGHAHESRLFAVEPRLKSVDLARIGAKPTSKKLGKSRVEMVGARGIEPLTPTMSR